MYMSGGILQMLKYYKGDFFMGNEDNRNRWIKKQLEKMEDGKRLIDVGAGELRWKNACSHLQYVSQDFCQYSGGGDNKGLQCNEFDTSHIDIVSDIIDIPVEDESFDAVLCSEVIEHIPYPEMAVKEISRILKTGGELILTAPVCSFTHMAPYYFYNGFSKYWYEEVLGKYNLVIEEITPNGNFFSYIRQELGRVGYIFDLYSEKKNFFIIVLSKLLRRALKKYDNIEHKSSEVVCFGYHVRARKIG